MTERPEVPVVPLEPEGDYAAPREVEPVRYCICGGIVGAHDHEARMKANYEASQVGIAESVHERRVAEA